MSNLSAFMQVNKTGQEPFSGPEDKWHSLSPCGSSHLSHRVASALCLVGTTSGLSQPIKESTC